MPVLSSLEQIKRGCTEIRPSICNHCVLCYRKSEGNRCFFYHAKFCGQLSDTQERHVGLLFFRSTFFEFHSAVLIFLGCITKTVLSLGIPYWVLHWPQGWTCQHRTAAKYGQIGDIMLSDSPNRIT